METDLFLYEPIIQDIILCQSQDVKIPVKFLINRRQSGVDLFRDHDISYVYNNYSSKFDLRDIIGLYSLSDQYDSDKAQKFWVDHGHSSTMYETDLLNWKANLETKIDDEAEIIKTAEEFRQQLLKYDPVIPARTINKSELHYTILMGSDKITPDHGHQIFNHSVTTNNIPFIQWNNETEQFFRLHEDFSKQDSIIVNKTSNHIYFIISVDGLNLTGIIDLNTSILSIDATDIKEDNIADFLQISFPNITFVDVKLGNIKAAMTYKVGLDYMSFLDAILSPLSRIMSHFLFLRENDVAQADKDSMSIYFRRYNDKLERNEYSIKFTITNATAAGFKVTTSESTTIEILEYFEQVFSRLIMIYREVRVTLVESMTMLGLPYIENKPVVDINSEVSKLASLRQKQPDIFSGAYNSICQCGFQPVIIEGDEVEAWKQLKTSDGAERSIGVFPPADPSVKDRFMFVCPDDSNPYPVLKENSRGDNKKTVPYFPCCHKKPENISASEYWEALRGGQGPLVKTKQKNTNTLKTNKILSFGSQGIISPSLTALLNSETPDQQYVFMRQWVEQSPSSLIHAVYQAKNPVQYNDDKFNRHDAIMAIRAEISDYHPGFFRQELYDRTNQQILDILRDPEQFLAPDQFFRGVEEYFQVNVVVFTYDAKGDLVLDLPRSKNFCCRQLEFSETVIIIKNYNQLNQPHCELIINNGKQDKTITEKKFIHGETVTKILRNLIDHETNYRVWSIPGSIETLIPSYKIENRKSPFSLIYWGGVISHDKITSQWIDNNGKCVGLNFIHDKQKLTIFIPPTVPFNVPDAAECHLTSVEMARAIFGSPSGMLSSGVWFPVMDYKWGIFVPVSDGTPQKNVPECPVRYDYRPDLLHDYTRIKKHAKILTKMIVRCWQIDQRDGWWSYFVVEDSSLEEQPYPPVRLREFIPAAKNSSDLITIFEEWWPVYFHGKKIHLSPKIYRKMKSFLEKFARDTRGLPVASNIFVTEMFEEEQDFRPCDRSIVLIGEDKFMSWYHHRDTDLQIQSTLSLNDQTKMDPIIYRAPTRRYYIIQNLSQDGDNFEKAYACGDYWKKMSHNKIETPKISIAEYVIYRIDPEGNLVISKLSSDEPSQEAIEILQYSEHRFAAMLPL